MSYFYPRKLFQHLRMGYLLPLHFSGVYRTNQKIYFKEREAKSLQRLSHVMQKFSKKLKTETKTRLHSCAFLTAFQVLVIKHFLWPHSVQGETFTSSFSAKDVDSPSQLLCRRRKWSHRKTDKKLDTPCNSSLLQERGIEIGQKFNHNFYFAQLHVVGVSAQNCWYNFYQ